MTLDYYLLPAHLRDGMRRYFEFGIETGSYLRAVLEKNFERQELLADAASLRGELGTARFLLGAPAEAWGSKATVQAWIDKHAGLERQRREDFGPNGDATTPGFFK